MEANQIGAGGLQSVNLYQQNQENKVSSGQEDAQDSDPVESGQAVSVSLSLQSVELSKRGQEQNLETARDGLLQQDTEQQNRQRQGSIQGNVTDAPQPERIDLFA